MDYRVKLLSWFAWLVGGWNATPNKHYGRLSNDCNIDSDERVARHILEQHCKDIERPLHEEITRLKAQVYDLQNKPQPE